MKIWKRLAIGALSVMMLCSSVACGDTENASGDHQHKAVRRAGITPTCQKTGKLEHWECIIDGCGKLFADSACSQEISKTDTALPKAAHGLTNHAKVEATETEHGNIEYWTCGACGKYFSDVLAKNEITQADTVDPSLISLVDFHITIPDDRDPVILQLGDPQIIDSDQATGSLNDKAKEMWKWGKDVLEEHCYKYIRETVEATNPDLILVTGDIIYGSYDVNGRVLEDFVAFMETLDVKWAPVMGNHDVESAKGADWQCQQYENAPNCLFKQGDIMGNGNYTIGIMQGGELRRVIVNMDTNGCTGASQASKNNGQTVHHGNNSYGKPFGTYGLQKDQVKWFNDTVKGIQKFVPDVKVSFHLHIPMNAAAEAFNNAYKDLTGNNPVASVNAAGKFGNTKVTRVLYPERIAGHVDGDIGTLYWLWQGDPVPDFWDTAGVHGTVDNTIFNQMKALGTDSFFFGHMHSNSASIVYDGIRFQYGQKCSTYDTTQFIKDDGSISYGNIYYDAEGRATNYDGTEFFTPLVGGTVNPMDKDTGELKNPYIYYCTGAGKEVDWAQYKKASA